VKAVLILFACVALLLLSLAISPGSAGLSLVPGAAPVGPRLTPTASRTPRAWLPIVIRNIPVPTPTYTVTRTPSPTSTATATATRTATATPTTPVAGPCSCSANLYNCTDFNTQNQAQACFNFCVSQGQGDIHGLDSDNDGEACESLP
jgi:hypothetical protein